MWIIEKDHLWNEDGEMKSRVGYHSKDYDEVKMNAQLLVEFRVLDDDGIVYYSGKMTKERIEDSETRAFDVLDWAEYDAGCTELQYRPYPCSCQLHTQWETL